MSIYGLFVVFLGSLSLFGAKKKHFYRRHQASVVFVVMVCALIVAVAHGEVDIADMQPAALGYAGIFGLRQSYPELTGQGVTIAAVCRSLTYIDGEPQNDYRLNITHNCFSECDITFADGLDSNAGASEQSSSPG